MTRATRAVKRIVAPALAAVALIGLVLPSAAQQGPMHDRMGGTDMMGRSLPGAMSGRGHMEERGEDRGDNASGWTMGPGMMGPGMMGPGMMHGGTMMRGVGPGRYIDGRIAFLEAELHITAAQRDRWKAFAEAMRDSAGSMQAMHDRMMGGASPETLPERLKWREEAMAARLESLKKMREAAGPLYEALSAGQKKAADTLLGMGMM